jgi:aerobic carbon-monoxide dehydrogenase medium subunit
MSIEYHEPHTLEDALRHLRDVEGARCIAGGQTLVAMLNAALIEPTALVSLARISELGAISREEDGSLRLGATVTHESVSNSEIICRDFSLIAATARAIAHPPIRSFGTIGGAVAHGDPSSDYPGALVASDARIEIAGMHGRRIAPAAEFFQDYLTTELEPAEIVTAVIVPAPPQGTRSDYFKFVRVDGDYATVSVAVLLGCRKDVCSHIAVALGAVGPRPVRDRVAEAALIGKALTDEALDELGNTLAAACDPVDDVRGSAAYRRGLVPKLVSRAVNTLRQ